MAIPLRARRAPVPSVGTKPAPPSSGKESFWPIVVLAALLVVGFLLMGLMVYVIFSPGMA